MILAATLISDRKFYSWPVALGYLTREPLVDMIYINIQTSNKPLYDPVIAALDASGKRYAVDFWDISHSSYRQVPQYDQDQARLAPICIGRNMAVDVALWPEFTHLLFVDSDVRPHPSGLSRLIGLDKPLVGGLVPGRGAHSGVSYVFGEIERHGNVIKCAHGTMGYCLIQRRLYEVLRFRYGPHPIKRETWLSEDPCFAADAATFGLADGWYIDRLATADHVDNPDAPLTLEGAHNGYTPV